jgi:hypothetical protein
VKFPGWLAMRRITIFSLAIIVPIGFCCKLYRGPGAFWVNNSLGGVFYEIFWCLFIFLFRPGWQPRRIAGIVFAVTCALEFLQLWHPPWLEAARSNFLGATILGTTFDWSDFAYYVIGSSLGWMWMQRLGAWQSH